MTYLFVQKLKTYWSHYRLVIVAFLIGGGLSTAGLYWIMTHTATPPEPEETFFLETTVAETTTTTTVATDYYVDIKGAVHSPGVYQMREGDRIQQLIDRAGGFTEEADQSQINLAQKVADQMVVVVPAIGQATPLPSVQGGTSAPANGGTQQGKIHLNTATAEELQTLKGIGQKKAEAIIQYRQEHGSFQSIEELQQVKGIGPKVFEKLKDSVMVP